MSLHIQKNTRQDSTQDQKQRKTIRLDKTISFNCDFVCNSIYSKFLILQVLISFESFFFKKSTFTQPFTLSCCFTLDIIFFIA